MLTNYKNAFADCAVFLPSLSKPFSEFGYPKNGSFERPQPFKPTDLNFLDPNNPLFFYPYALYSAGTILKETNLTYNPNNIVTQRDRDQTKIVCDSGGYSVLNDKGITYTLPTTVVDDSVKKRQV